MRGSYQPMLTVAFLLLAAAGAAGSADNRHLWTADDIVTAESARSWAVSRDGTVAVWVRSGVASVKGVERRVSNLWLTRLGSGSSLQLTRGHDTVSAPEIAPDGAHAAFLSNREIPAGKGKDELGRTQLWAIPLGGGEAFPVTRFDRSVRAFGWIDEATLLVAAEESPSQWELERKGAKDDSVVVDDAAHKPPVRLFRVPLKKGQARRLTNNEDWIDALAVSPDGRRAVIRAQQSLSYEFDQATPPHTTLVDLADGRMRRLFSDGTLLPRSLRWAPDGAGFYLVNEHSRHPRYRTATIAQLWYYDLASGRAEEVDLAWPRGRGRGDGPVADGVIARRAHGVRFRPAWIHRTDTGWRREDLAGAHVGHIAAVAAAGDGTTLLYERSTATTAPQWWAARRDGARLSAEQVLTDLNSGYEGKPTGRVEVVRWKGARDEEVEGLLHYPLDYQEGRRYPLILDIHGGPTGTDMDLWSQSWASPVILWRQAGAFVFQVNYHGSAGYGLDWVESIGEGAYYELEVPDIERGVDTLIARGLVDAERLATSGWSNGGILSAELITRTTRYKAASVGAADVEWFSDWGNVDFGAAFDNYYFGGTPWEIPEVYREKSPFFRLTEVTTPTIVYTGTKDRNVPPHQSWSLFRALQQIGRAPARLVLFPGEPHGLRVVAHQRRKIAEDLAWFERYLFGTATQPNEAVKKGSLLAGLVARGRAARVGSAFGVEENGLLVPETVVFEGLEVGRFEVTRMQWAAFDPASTPRPGEENLPVTGVTFERARAYAAWLAERTGRPFRLPTVGEAERLAAAAGGGGNTLDRWAGYAPNPDDAVALRRALAGLGASPLLLPVGSLTGAGEAAVFDLDGNAAEWAVDDGGAGRALGPSADRPIDGRAADAPAPAYTGLRVVVGGEG